MAQEAGLETTRAWHRIISTAVAADRAEVTPLKQPRNLSRSTCRELFSWSFVVANSRVTAAEALLHIQESLALESEEDFSSSDESGEDSEEERLYFGKRIDPKEDFCKR
ncbi:hypothetical protein MHYP_G00148560 [Metynnis hypsauchen]